MYAPIVVDSFVLTIEVQYIILVFLSCTLPLPIFIIPIIALPLTVTTIGLVSLTGALSQTPVRREAVIAALLYRTKCQEQEKVKQLR